MPISDQQTNAPAGTMLILFDGALGSQYVKKELPYPMGLEAASSFIWGWLQTADYGVEPRTDGSYKKGFWFQTSRSGWNQEIFQIATSWMIWGK